METLSGRCISFIEQKFLNGKTDNLKLDRWSLELQGRNIQVEHIAGVA